MTERKIEQELLHDGQVLRLVLSAPKANILDLEMMGQLIAALRAHGAEPGLKAIVFEGSGKHFSFGASIEEHAKHRVREMLPRFHELFLTLAELAVPTFAIVRGQCLGGGLELASYAGWIFAGPNAVFGQPEIKLAVFPPAASVLLPWRVGGPRAVDLCVSGRSVTAEEALRMGLVHSVDEDPAGACHSFIQEHLLPKSGPSLRFAERAARRALFVALREELPRLEALYIEELMETPDANEGINSFIERRQPRFGRTGR